MSLGLGLKLICHRACWTFAQRPDPAEKPGEPGADVYQSSTLIISMRGDGSGSYLSSQYAASRIVCSNRIGFDQGSHTWVGHDGQVRTEIVTQRNFQAKR